MAIICGKCANPISRRDSCVSCCVCKKEYHSTCISKSLEFLELLNKIEGLSWKCHECIKVNEFDISKLIDEKILNAISTLNDTVERLKADILKLTENKTCNCDESKVSENKPKYSDILKNKTNPAVIIQPRNQSQEYSQTRSELLKKINPVSSNIQLSKVVNVKNGGVLVSCSNKNENEKFKKMVEENLSDSYVIREVHGVHPRVRIVGITEKYQENELLECIIKCNSDLILENSVCKLIKLCPTKKNKDIYQAVLQIDKNTYGRVSRVGNLFVNYDSCVVFDAIEVYRCYNCNEFHHSSKTCKNPVVCPLCGKNHDIKACKSKSVTCSNCVKLNEKQNIEVSVDHAAWNIKLCSAYKRACEKVKSDILIGQ